MLNSGQSHAGTHSATFAAPEQIHRMAKSIKKKDNTEQVLQSIVDGMLEKKAQHIVVLDLRKLNSTVADYFVICHGSSTTQVEAIARSVEEFTEKELGESPLHIEGVTNAQWILMDYFTVVVHIFEEKARSYYDLEELWADAAVLPVEERA
jgi:ribosome-associated protein